MSYTPANWYWVIAGSTTQVYSSAGAAFVAPTDATYTAWLAAGNIATRIDSDASLIDVLSAAYPAGISAALSPTLAQQATTAMAAGITLTLSGSLVLSATVFPTDAVTQTKLAAVATTINTTGSFPGGATSYPMKDASGAWHTFTLAQYKAVAAAIAGYAAALDLIIDGNPLEASTLPSATAALTLS